MDDRSRLIAEAYASCAHKAYNQSLITTNCRGESCINVSMDTISFRRNCFRALDHLEDLLLAVEKPYVESLLV